VTGRVASINRSDGGVPKQPVEACAVRILGLEGDRQRDHVHHGGPDRAVVLYSLERIAALQREGHPIAVGSIGENLTLSGLDWDALAPGARLRVGEVELELTRYASPCWNIAASFRDGAYERVSQKLYPGWSRLCARVLAPGRIEVGAPVALVGSSDERPAPSS
jgi:MOSC domain-containing protein YiiM